MPFIKQRGKGEEAEKPSSSPLNQSSNLARLFSDKTKFNNFQTLSYFNILKASLTGLSLLLY